MECHLRTCMKNISPSDARVEVRFEPEKCDAAIRWPFCVDEHGVAIFHRYCWDRLAHQSSGGRPKRSRLKRLIQEAGENAEIFDSRESMIKEAEKTTVLLRSCKHAVVFTGAGISTSAGIGDFRGLFGKWTEDDMGVDTSETNNLDEVPYEDLRPTLAHEAVSWLIEHGLVKYVVTQNCDGLHVLSGVQNSCISELHGNVFVEYCMLGCGKEFVRNYDVENDEANAYFEELQEHGKTWRRKPKNVKQCRRCKLTHQTTRRCPDCQKPLFDTIINFGDFLRPCQIDKAVEHSEKADLMLVLGSTVRVTPASDLCGATRRQKIVVCNRQRTHLDSKAEARVFGDCDEFMELLLQRLMGDDAFDTWKQERQQRMLTYDKTRRHDE